MTFQLDDEVITDTGKTFKISQISKDPDGALNYSVRNENRWYPASLLRLVETLKIGDWVQHGDDIFQIQVGSVCEGESYFSHVNGNMVERWHPAKSLRKLTPEEVAMHTGTIGYKINECQEEMEKAQETLREILAPLVDERLSAIEGLVNEHISGHAACKERRLGKVEERLSAIEKKQQELDSHVDEHRQSHAKWRDRTLVAEKRLDDLHNFVYPIQKGEMPEVCDCPNDGCMPNDVYIHISIQKSDGAARGIKSKCPSEALAWCEKVLDSMREA